jgi:hypothetical protein
MLLVVVLVPDLHLEILLHLICFYGSLTLSWQPGTTLHTWGWNYFCYQAPVE